MAQSKPEYVELLNEIKVQEYGAGDFLRAWADKTEDSGLKGCLTLVAARETSHGEIFERRIKELGYEPEGDRAANFAERMEVLSGDLSDAEKIKYLREGAQNMAKPTVRERYEAATVDESVDELTRSLLRWFTDVENDSGGHMREEYARIEGSGS